MINPTVAAGMVKELTDERDKLKDWQRRTAEVLKWVEWCALIQCPICRGISPKQDDEELRAKGYKDSDFGHKPDCALKKLIDEVEGK